MDMAPGHSKAKRRGIDRFILRERPFNFKGGGGAMFFLEKKNSVCKFA